jgi:hypothetical protein
MFVLCRKAAQLKIFYMYTYIWNKYLPVIRILLKKSAAGDQLLSLNREDFERAGTGRKAGYKFVIAFTDGKVSNVISGSDLASHLASAMLEDDATKAVLRGGQYEVILNTKFQLTIKNTAPQPAPQATAEANAD